MLINLSETCRIINNFITFKNGPHMSRFTVFNTTNYQGINKEILRSARQQKIQLLCYALRGDSDSFPKIYVNFVHRPVQKR